MPQETFDHNAQTYVTALVTDLVGREREFQRVRKAASDAENDYIFYLFGQGGIGKTFFLKHVLDKLVNSGYAVGEELIDLYSTVNRSPEGLVEAIANSFNPDDFAAYHGAREKLDEYYTHPPEKYEDFQRHRDQVFAAFFDDFNQLTGHKRVVLAFDTAEYLFYEHDPVQDQVGLREERSAVYTWLLSEFLPRVENAVILISGRPEPKAEMESFLEALGAVENQQLKHIKLSGLSESEAMAYFDALIEAAEDSDSSEAGDFVQRFFGAEETKQKLFWGLCDETDDPPTVRPLLLALAIDYHSYWGERLNVIGPETSLDEVRNFTQAERRTVEKRLVDGIANAIDNVSRDADVVIRALAWARKGATPELIAHMLSPEEAAWTEARVKEWLEKQKLAFIKRLNGRVFLHDEMYYLLRKRLLKPFMLTGQLRSVQDELEALRECVAKRIEEARSAIVRLQRQKKSPARQVVRQLWADFQNALAEKVHYDLWYRLDDPIWGFQTYYGYAEEATTAKNEDLDIQLRAELLNTLAEIEKIATEEGGNEVVENIAQLRQQILIPDAAVRWIKRLIKQGRAGEALELAELLQNGASHLMAEGDEWVEMELDVWNGLAHTHQGDLQAASQLLNVERIDALESQFHLLEEQSRDSEQSRRRRPRTILARAYNNIGYLARVRGQFVMAAEYYNKALPYWRDLKMEVEHANTLNNLSFSLGLQGRFAEARRYALDAYNLRKQLGERIPTVLSLTTLAAIELHAGRFDKAKDRAEEALKLAQDWEYQRGRGLAYWTLALVYRFQAEPEEEIEPEKRKESLNRSVEQAQRAYRIFKPEGASPELEHEIQALTALGTALRERFRLGREEGLAMQMDADFEEAEDYLERAARSALRERGRFWNLYLDASLSLAWLYYYGQREEKLSRLQQNLRKEIEENLSDYLISPEGFPQIQEDTMLDVFSQLGRHHMLSAIQAIDAYESRSPRQLPSPHLEEAALELALTFQYDCLIAEDFRDLQRAINVLYNRLKKFNSREMFQLYEALYEAVQDAPDQVLPADISVRDLKIWKVLEENFGSYETFKRLS